MQHFKCSPTYLYDVDVVVEYLVHDPLLDGGGLGEVEPGVPLRDPVVEEDEGRQALEAVCCGLLGVLYLDDRDLRSMARLK